MNTNELFERVVCVTSESADKTWQQMRRHCDVLGIRLNQISAIDGGLQPLPHGANFTTYELGALLTFYSIIRQAYKDRVNSVLVLGDGVLFHRQYAELEEVVIAQIPSDWDLLYWGHEEAQFREPVAPDKSQLVRKVFCATGTHAIGVHNDFYHLFLEDARVPRYSLNAHIHAVSLVCDIFVVIPPLVEFIRA